MIFRIILNILVVFWRAKNTLENNVSHFSINSTAQQRSVGRKGEQSTMQKVVVSSDERKQVSQKTLRGETNSSSGTISSF